MGAAAPGFGAADREMLSLSYYMVVATAAASEAFALDHALLLAPTVERREELRRLEVDGVVICDPVAADPRLDLFAEQGVPGYDVSVFFGVVGPKSMPVERVELRR